MNNYEYIIASLPDITTGWKFGEKGPEDYIEEIVNLCSDKDRELIEFLLDGYQDEKLDADFYAKALVHTDSFISLNSTASLSVLLNVFLPLLVLPLSLSL